MHNRSQEEWAWGGVGSLIKTKVRYFILRNLGDRTEEMGLPQSMKTNA